MKFEEVDSGTWCVTLQRPERRNALRVADYVLLADLLRQIERSGNARVIVLSGEGRDFCSGNDLAEFAIHWPQPVDGPVARFFDALRSLQIPLVAAVQGAAVGLGATMLLHFDVVVASEDAFLSYPFVDLGITVEFGASILLPERIGRARAMDVLLTGRRVGAREALALGLISRISGSRLPIEEALDVAWMIASKPAAAISSTRALVNAQIGSRLGEQIRAEITEINRLIALGRASASSC